MNKLILVLSLILATSAFVSAQSTDYNKGEVYVGYSNGQVDTGFDSGNSVNSFLRDRTNFHGFEAAGVYNVSRYVGIKADVSGTYNSTRFSFPIITGPTTQTVTIDTKNALYNILGGIQIKDNSKEGRLKPFAHVLVGAGHARTKVESVNCTTTAGFDCGVIGTGNSTGFAGAFGGGLDIRINDKVDFRAFSIDYNPVFHSGGTDHNARIGFGIVIK